MYKERYDIIKKMKEIPSSRYVGMYSGIADDDDYGDLIKSHDKLDDALHSLMTLNSSVKKLNHHGRSYYLVVEYSVEHNIYDADGYWLSGGEVLGHSIYKEQRNER